MALRTLTAVEYERLPVGGGSDALSAADVQRLLAIKAKRPGFCELGHNNVKLAQHVGLMRLDGRMLEVLPKVGEIADAARSRGTLLRLLGMAYDLPITTSGGATHDLQRHTLLDVFIAVFLQEVSTLVRGGLVRRYRAEADDLRVVRGRLDIRRQATALAMRADKIACRYDELSLDNPWNQFLKVALAALRPWLRNLETHRRWMELWAAFDEVETCREPLRLQLKADRLVHHYRASLTWARWVLRLLSPNLRAGETEAPELLFDMNQLFEQAVATHLRRRARHSGLQLVAQETRRYLATAHGETTSLHYGLRPDLLLRDGDNVVVVADTKWTHVGATKGGTLLPPAHHVYQMHAYAAAYPGAELALLYPFANAGEPIAATAFRIGDALLHVLRIDATTTGLPLMGARHSSLIGDVW